MVAEGEICQVEGGTGGVSLPDVERRRLAEGGVPIANCTLGGEIELMSRLQLLLRRFDCFMLIGCERGIPLGAVEHCCKKTIKKNYRTSSLVCSAISLLLVAIEVGRFCVSTERASPLRSEVYLVVED